MRPEVCGSPTAGDRLIPLLLPNLVTAVMERKRSARELVAELRRPLIADRARVLVCVTNLDDGR
jgi:hypothetical protein